MHLDVDQLITKTHFPTCCVFLYFFDVKRIKIGCIRQKKYFKQLSSAKAPYRYNILSVCRAAPKSWSEYTTDELKSEKLVNEL